MLLRSTFILKFYKVKKIKIKFYTPLNTGRKLNVLCTFNLRPVPRGTVHVLKTSMNAVLKMASLRGLSVLKVLAI